jgi:hypothetical protein
LDDTVDPLTVDFIAAGSAPFATRDDLAAALAPKALDADEARARTEAFDALLTPWSCSRQGLTDLVTLLRQRDPMDWAQVALCCTLLDDFRWRDALLRQVLEDASLRLPVRATLMDIATRCPEAYVASTATTLAGVVWLDGNGTVARVAVDRALESNPEYSLARLLDRAFEAGIPPRVWIDSLSALTVDECMAA